MEKFIQGILDKTDLDEKIIKEIKEFVDEVEEKKEDIEKKLDGKDMEEVKAFINLFKKTYKEVMKDGKISKDGLDIIKSSFKNIKAIIKKLD